VVIRKRVSRDKVLEFFADLSLCLVGIEACPTAIIAIAGAHREVYASELR
jgi:hypothetical protein